MLNATRAGLVGVRVSGGTVGFLGGTAQVATAEDEYGLMRYAAGKSGIATPELQGRSTAIFFCDAQRHGTAPA